MGVSTNLLDLSCKTTSFYKSPLPLWSHVWHLQSIANSDVSTQTETVHTPASCQCRGSPWLSSQLTGQKGEARALGCIGLKKLFEHTLALSVFFIPSVPVCVFLTGPCSPNSSTLQHSISCNPLMLASNTPNVSIYICTRSHASC